MKLLAFHDPALGLIFEPDAITYTVPISVNQFWALHHCADDDDSGGFSDGGTLWYEVKRSTPITCIDFHGPLEKPCIRFDIPADEINENTFATISAAIWKLLDTCVAKRDKDMAEGENA